MRNSTKEEIETKPNLLEGWSVECCVHENITAGYYLKSSYTMFVLVGTTLNYDVPLFTNFDLNFDLLQVSLFGGTSPSNKRSENKESKKEKVSFQI